MSCRFDWYSATMDVPPSLIADALISEHPAASSWREGRGQNGYARSMSVTDSDGETLATILHGGRNMAPHAYASGCEAPVFSDIIRRHWPDAHKVTRLDSCRDVPGSFEDLHPALQILAKARGLLGESRIPDDPERGATYYLGSPSSRVRMRMYEKGKELRSKGHEVTEDDLEMLRFEVQLRPTKEGRETAAHLSPDEVWGATHWAAEVARQHLFFDPSRVNLQFRLKTTFERRCRAAVAQYGLHLYMWQQQEGGWPQLGAEIERRLGLRDADAGE